MQKLIRAFTVFALTAAPIWAQITRADAQFAGLSARTRLMAYQQGGGDMSKVSSLMAEAAKAAATDPVAAYRAYTRATEVMSERGWTPASELTTGLDFSINAKVIGPGDSLAARALFLFDAPAATEAPYRLDLEILKADGTKEAAVEPGILLGDVRGRRGGEMAGVIFDPSKLVPPGLHMLRGTLKDGRGTALFQYSRTFFLIADLAKRLGAMEKTLELLRDQKSAAATNVRYVLDTVRQAQHSYLAGGFQSLSGYLHTAYRARGLALKEAADFEGELEWAAKLAAALQEGRNPLEAARGALRMAYRSGFDGKLVPYKVFLPSTYSAAKKYPLVVLLHGAGGDENVFIDDYQGLWPKLAEQRGYLLASVNGRGPTSGYAKANGAEQDVLDVLDLMKKQYSVDPARVYLAGHSMGAAGTWRIGLEYRDRFAGLVPIAGSNASPLLDTALSTGARIPIFIVAGAKDALVPVSGCRAAAEMTKAKGFPMKYLEYPDGDHLSVAITSVPEIFNWFDTLNK